MDGAHIGSGSRLGSSDLTGLAMVAVLAAGAYVLLSSGALKNTNADTLNTDDPGFTEGEGSESQGGSSSCKSLCRDKDCDGYDEEGCTAGCSACKSGGGSGGGSPGNTSGSGSSANCDDGHACGTRCAKGWCTSFRKCCKNYAGGCANCNVGGSGGGTNAQDLCRRKECVNYIKRYGKSGCSKCSCSNLCKSSQCGTFRSAGCTGKCPCISKGPAGTNTGGGSFKCTSAGRSCGYLKTWVTSGGKCVCKQTQKAPAPKPKPKGFVCTSAGRSCGFNKVWKTSGGKCVCTTGKATKLARVLRANSRLAWRMSVG